MKKLSDIKPGMYLSSGYNVLAIPLDNHKWTQMAEVTNVRERTVQDSFWLSTLEVNGKAHLYKDTKQSQGTRISVKGMKKKKLLYEFPDYPGRYWRAESYGVPCAMVKMQGVVKPVDYETVLSDGPGLIGEHRVRDAKEGTIRWFGVVCEREDPLLRYSIDQRITSGYFLTIDPLEEWSFGLLPPERIHVMSTSTLDGILRNALQGAYRRRREAWCTEQGTALNDALAVALQSLLTSDATDPAFSANFHQSTRAQLSQVFGSAIPWDFGSDKEGSSVTHALRRNIVRAIGTPGLKELSQVVEATGLSASTILEQLEELKDLKYELDID